MRRPPLPNQAAYHTSRHNHGHSFRITGSAVIRISPWRRRTTNRISDVACFRSRPVRAGQPPRARPTHAISSADILNYNRWAVLQRGISFYSSNPNSALEEISRSSPTLHPCCRLLTIVRLESVSNCRKTSNCVRRNIRWIGSGVIAGPWARRTFAPMAQMVSMPPLACAGLSEDTGTREPRLTINPGFDDTWTSSRWRDLNSRSFLDECFSFFVVQLAGKSFQLVTRVEFTHLLGIFPPIRCYFHEQSKVELAA